MYVGDNRLVSGGTTWRDQASSRALTVSRVFAALGPFRRTLQLSRHGFERAAESAAFVDGVLQAFVYRGDASQALGIGSFVRDDYTPG